MKEPNLGDPTKDHWASNMLNPSAWKRVSKKVIGNVEKRVFRYEFCDFLTVDIESDDTKILSSKVTYDAEGMYDGLAARHDYFDRVFAQIEKTGQLDLNV